MIGVLTFFLPTARQLTIAGSAASFPLPLYSVRSSTYGAETDRVRLDGPSVGSGAGVRNFINRIVDCGAGDATMTDEEIARVDGGVVLLPMTAAEIDRRHDARIAAADPDAAPPDRPRGSGGLSGGHAHPDAVRSRARQRRDPGGAARLRHPGHSGRPGDGRRSRLHPAARRTRRAGARGGRRDPITARRPRAAIASSAQFTGPEVGGRELTGAAARGACAVAAAAGREARQRSARRIAEPPPDAAADLPPEAPPALVDGTLDALDRPPEPIRELSCRRDRVACTMQRCLAAGPTDWTSEAVIADVRAEAERIDRLVAVHVIDAERRRLGCRRPDWVGQMRDRRGDGPGRGAVG